MIHKLIEANVLTRHEDRHVRRSTGSPFLFWRLRKPVLKSKDKTEPIFTVHGEQ
jgi:hypothetical protein